MTFLWQVGLKINAAVRGDQTQDHVVKSHTRYHSAKTAICFLYLNTFINHVKIFSRTRSSRGLSLLLKKQEDFGALRQGDPLSSPSYG
jgi:hypothetical protein